MNTVITGIRRKLKANADPAIRESSRKFFKEEVRLYGLKTDAVRRIGKEFYKTVKGLPKSGIFNMCEELWQSGYMEESFIACDWSYFLRTRYEPRDGKVFAKWVNSYVSNWAACDTLCNHTVGAFIQMYPGYVAELKKWARSKNRWTRRAAAVSLIVPAKKGRFLSDIFALADILLEDPDDLVRKGYGWLLKAASRVHQKEVFAYVMKNRTRMPRTALRYAVEKMPRSLKVQAM